ncbi:unnamed protein product [Thelazia callipaeda]|uniref:N-acetyltransferase domain-containing protein n=1 Tax=Thelazia callipaeda TaxID=103827 RepID=A0A0N5CQN6_THECL|nr:unnamed protein product [Thelazia callipaeda]
MSNNKTDKVVDDKELINGDNDDNDDDVDDIGKDEVSWETVSYLPGSKEDFVSLINASNESDGWVRKYRDYDCYQKMLAPGKLHFVSARTKIGEYVGSCICMEFDDYAFVAMYYVRAEYRKKKIGTELFKRVVDDKLRKKNIGLHAGKMSSIYDQVLGFSIRTSWVADTFFIKNIDITKIIVQNTPLIIKDAKEVDLSQIVDYDAKVVKWRREGFVKHWGVDRVDAVCKVLVNSEGEVIGYGCGRLLSIVGYPTFGPIYCDSDDGFKLLFHALASCFNIELKEQNLICLRVLSAKSNAIQQVLYGAAADIEKSEFAEIRHIVINIYCSQELATQPEGRGETIRETKRDAEGDGSLSRQSVRSSTTGFRHLPLARIIAQREIYGTSKLLRRLTCRIHLEHLECPYLVQISGLRRFLNIIRECIFLGFSNDSRYVVALLYLLPQSYRLEGDDDSTELHVIVFELSTTIIRPAFITKFPYWPSTAKIFATFPRNSSHISIIGFAKQNNEPANIRAIRENVEPYSVIAKVKFILFRFNITVSFTTYLVMSYRWDNECKLSGTVLRSTDQGGIINAGTSLVSYMFTKDCPPVKIDDMMRMVLKVVDSKVVDDGLPIISQGCNSYEIEIEDAITCYGNVPRNYNIKKVFATETNPSADGLREPLFITETVIDIERLLYEILPIFFQRFYGAYNYEGLIDYEVDLLSYENYVANFLLTSVVEAKGPGIKGRNCAYITVFSVEWDTYEGTRSVFPFRGIRLIPWSVARRPNWWYPFNVSAFSGEHAPEDRVISNIPFLDGKSLRCLSSPSPGISLWRDEGFY